MGHKLKRADGVRNAFQEVTLSVSEVIHGVCIPVIARTDVGHIQHAIHDRIAEVHIVACHVNLGTKYHLTGFYVTAIHLFK